MALFLGYDPGGRGKHGVAAIEVVGKITKVIEASTTEDAGAALLWLKGFDGEATALGIDTLLAWTLHGDRACDKALRAKYKSRKVITQNSLYSSMTLNGAFVAKRIGLPLYESHPKLLLELWVADEIRETWQQVIDDGSDHAGDAVIAAWCAAMGETGEWAVDLFEACKEDYEFVAPRTRYPWFETPE
ncbi:hypothetical protein [Amaricoccus tamworthensis]|uniref:hypothetical protein n=1 Tax=Amaricoccus tamworthensis TaxID=57002 RepID=UPI003C7DA783